MKASDTLLSKDRLLQIRQRVFADNPGTIVDTQTNTAKEQAEITWQAAIKEVVDFIEENRVMSSYWNWEDDPEWQSKLKELGVYE